VSTQMRLARGLRWLHVAAKWYALACPVVLPLSAEIVVCAECILYSGFGTFTGMADLNGMLSKPDWECTGSLSIAVSNGQADGSRCFKLLKGKRCVHVCAFRHDGCALAHMGCVLTHDLHVGDIAEVKLVRTHMPVGTSSKATFNLPGAGEISSCSCDPRA
jgi:hypothetical protein